MATRLLGDADGGSGVSSSGSLPSGKIAIIVKIGSSGRDKLADEDDESPFGAGGNAAPRAT
jgi:hypothetical protein